MEEFTFDKFADMLLKYDIAQIIELMYLRVEVRLRKTGSYFC